MPESNATLPQVTQAAAILLPIKACSTPTLPLVILQHEKQVYSPHVHEQDHYSAPKLPSQLNEIIHKLSGLISFQRCGPLQ